MAENATISNNSGGNVHFLPEMAANATKNGANK